MSRKESIQEKITKWNEQIPHLLTAKTLAVFLTVFYLMSLIPLLWIAWYNYPSADDYSIGSDCHRVWVASHNILAVVWQGIVRSVDDWINWMGYFTSNFLMAVPPSTFGERWYVLTTWIMLGMLSFSTIYFFHAVFVKVFQADRFVSLSASMLVLFISVQCMCPAGRVEAFYWYSGAANYILVHSMSLFFYGLLISAVFASEKKRVRSVLIASVLGFFTGGGNQMTALNVAVVLVVVTGVVLCRKHRKKYKALWIPAGSFFLGFVLNIAAPGNWVRAGDASGMNPMKAVLVSFYECLDRVINQWTTWPVIVLVIALVPLFWHMAENTAFSFPCPVLAVASGYCLTSAMMTPPLFAVGNMEAGRLQALTFLMYILMLSLCVGYVTGWARKKTECDRLGRSGREEAGKDEAKIQESAKTQAGKFLPESCWCLVACLVFLAFGSALTVVPDPHYYTFSSALTDLRSGSAREYGEALGRRAELYRTGSEGLIEVEPLPTQPALLYFSDIKEDPQEWENTGLCRYYGLEEVAVKR